MKKGTSRESCDGEASGEIILDLQRKQRRHGTTEFPSLKAALHIFSVVEKFYDLQRRSMVFGLHANMYGRASGDHADHS